MIWRFFLLTFISLIGALVFLLSHGQAHANLCTAEGGACTSVGLCSTYCNANLCSQDNDGNYLGCPCCDPSGYPPVCDEFAAGDPWTDWNQGQYSCVYLWSSNQASNPTNCDFYCSRIYSSQGVTCQASAIDYSHPFWACSAGQTCIPTDSNPYTACVQTDCTTGTTGCGACNGTKSEPTNTCNLNGVTGNGTQTCYHNGPTGCVNQEPFQNACTFNYTYDNCTTSQGYACVNNTTCQTTLTVNVFQDKNANGVWDAGEPGYNGTITINGASKTVTNGTYSGPHGYPQGNYTV